MAIYEGSGVALITPFTKTLEVNYEKLEEIVEEQIREGTDSIIVCGTTGETSTLSHEEQIRVIRFVCEVVNRRIPVIAGTGSNCTETAKHLSVEAQNAGADGLLVVSPYYNKATQAGLTAHFTTIASEVRVPVLLYEIPGRTGVSIEPETIVGLCKYVPNIVGVKEASGDFSKIATLFHLAQGCVDVYCGNDDQIVPLLSLGGKGVISVLANVAPKQTHEICASYFRGDVTTSMQMQIDAIGVIKELFCEVNPIPVKAAMNLLGKEVGSMRLPLTDMEPHHVEQLKQAMIDYKIL